MGLFLGFLSCSTGLYFSFCASTILLWWLQLCIIVWRLIPPAPFFFLKTSLAIWGLFCFCMNCEIFCSSSVKNAMGNLIGIALNLLEKAMAPHFSTLAWKIPWMVEPGRLQSMGSLGVRHNWATSLSLFTFMHWRRKWQPAPVFLPGESQGRRSLVGCHLWGHTESDMTEAMQQQRWICRLHLVVYLFSQYLFFLPRNMDKHLFM